MEITASLTSKADAEIMKARIDKLSDAFIEATTADGFVSTSIVTSATVSNSEIVLTFNPQALDFVVAAIDGRQFIAAACKAAGIDYGLTLKEKEAQLLTSVALPTADDWRFLKMDVDKANLVAEANAALIHVLEKCKANAYESWGKISEAIYSQLVKLDQKYPEAGLLDSEGYNTVARFFATNYTPEIFNCLRYPVLSKQSIR